MRAMAAGRDLKIEWAPDRFPEGMMTDNRLPAPPGNPRQFGIVDLFAVLTVGALVSAIVAPFVRAMTPANRGNLFAIAVVQLAVVTFTVVEGANRRGKLLQQAGRRTGIGYCGTVRWQRWPLFKSILGMLSIAGAQLGFSILFAMGPPGTQPFPNLLLYQLQLGYFTGCALSRLHWRVYPNAMEFFENGIALNGVRFVPWSLIQVRPSQHFPDRVVVVMRQGEGSVAGETRTVQLARGAILPPSGNPPAPAPPPGPIPRPTA